MLRHPPVRLPTLSALPGSSANRRWRSSATGYRRRRPHLDVRRRSSIFRRRTKAGLVDFVEPSPSPSMKNRSVCWLSIAAASSAAPTNLAFQCWLCFNVQSAATPFSCMSDMQRHTFFFYRENGSARLAPILDILYL